MAHRFDRWFVAILITSKFNSSHLLYLFHIFEWGTCQRRLVRCLSLANVVFKESVVPVLKKVISVTSMCFFLGSKSVIRRFPLEIYFLTRVLWLRWKLSDILEYECFESMINRNKSSPAADDRWPVVCQMKLIETKHHPFQLITAVFCLDCRSLQNLQSDLDGRLFTFRIKLNRRKGKQLGR